MIFNAKRKLPKKRKQKESASQQEAESLWFGKGETESSKKTTRNIKRVPPKELPIPIQYIDQRPTS